MILSDHKTYSEKWISESDVMDKAGVYSQLASLLPRGNVLEFGCGSGRGTVALSLHHPVISLENNEFLISECLRFMALKNVTANVRKCDFFSLSHEDDEAIEAFRPDIITGWLIGGSGTDQVLRVPGESDARELSKTYREKIEDIIVSMATNLPSVEYIHFASRGIGIAGADDSEVYAETKADYDRYVFNTAGFEVTGVSTVEWPLEHSQFSYSYAPNPAFAGGRKVKMTPVITSIIAKRINQTIQAV